MKYLIIDANNKEHEQEAESIEKAIKEIFKNNWKYTNWSILGNDITQIYKPHKGTYLLKATLDNNAKKIIMIYPEGYWKSEQE